MGFLLVMLEESEQTLEVQVIIETLPQCIIRSMAVKGNTVHLIDEANYRGSLEELAFKPWHWGLRRSDSCHPATYIAAPKRPHDLIKKAMTTG